MKKKNVFCRKARNRFGPVSSLAFLALVMLSWAVVPIAQAQIEPLSPFSITGFIDKATLNPPADVLAGGTITVNGQLVIVPRNIIVLMPANALTWQQVFFQAPAPYGPTQSGLAIQDIPQPLTTYQATISGNRVGNNYIAASVAIFPDSLSIGQGFITFIDYNLGEMRVGGVVGFPNTGVRVRINDPIGRYSRIDHNFLSGSPDPRFMIDEDNPTIRTTTGFPMCLQIAAPPFVDASCPTGNRPVTDGSINPASVFPQARNFPFVPAPGPGPSLPTPWLKMPFEVGDFINYAGITVKDGLQPTAGPLPVNGTDGTYILAYQIIADIAAYTAPGTDPAYVAIDVLLLETGPFVNPLPDLSVKGNLACVPIIGLIECGTRTRLEGFTTDIGPNARIIQLNGVHIDSLTGVATDTFKWNMTQQTNRGGANVTVADPETDPLPPIGAQPGRWRFRPGNKAFAPYGVDIFHAEVVPQVHASLVCPSTVGLTDPAGCLPSNPARLPSAGTGLVYGHYVAPIFDFIGVENIVGAPPVPMNYEDLHNPAYPAYPGALAFPVDPIQRSGFEFLWRGMGPVGAPGGFPAGTGPVIGRLNPFPISLGNPPAAAGVITFTGGLTTDLAFFRPSDGTWHVHPAVGLPFTVQWGTAGDVPVAGDYDGDGITDFAVWRPAEGNWYILNSSTGTPTVQQWGAPTDLPVRGDFDGDGKADFAVFRPAEGNWYILNSSGLPSPSTVQQWGVPTDIPVRGNFDGDAKTDIAVWRPAEGNWYIRNSSGLPTPITVQQWGSVALNDVLVPGDYNGDGKTDIAVWRPTDGNWYILNSSGLPSPFTIQQWGTGALNDVPVPGDYDGDGKTDFAVYRPTDGNWYIINSATGIVSVINFPLAAGDIPITLK